MIQQSLAGKWFFQKRGERRERVATVPGSVHTDLLALGLIPDPFVAVNEKLVQRVAETDWVYRRIFTVEPRLMAETKKYLVCDGLDTPAEVTVNGRLLGKNNNMFRRWQWDVGNFLMDGKNEMEQGWMDWGWNKPDDASNQSLKAGYDRMFHHILPEVVATEDTDRPYWPSSASSGLPFAEPNGSQRGDTHYWDIRHKCKPFTAYRQQFLAS